MKKNWSEYLTEPKPDAIARTLDLSANAATELLLRMATTPSPANTRHLHLLGATGQIRGASFENRDHLVVPVVALCEGVIHAINADAPEFVPISCLSVAESWNGRPIVKGHPTRNGEQISANEPAVLETAIGTVFNARIDGKRLLMDAYIDPLKAERVGASRMLERIRAGEIVEVSVGAFVTTEPRSGVHNGKRYKAIWQVVLPDHLALLETGRGACSVDAGCGTRAAESRPPEIAPIPDAWTAALATLQQHDGDDETKQRLQQMAADRQAVYDVMTIGRASRETRSTTRVYLEPPDPWAEAIKRRQEQR
jgi:hypothetical protein